MKLCLKIRLLKQTEGLNIIHYAGEIVPVSTCPIIRVMLSTGFRVLNKRPFALLQFFN